MTAALHQLVRNGGAEDGVKPSTRFEPLLHASGRGCRFFCTLNEEATKLQREGLRKNDAFLLWCLLIGQETRVSRPLASSPTSPRPAFPSSHCALARPGGGVPGDGTCCVTRNTVGRMIVGRTHSPNVLLRPHVPCPGSVLNISS